MFSASKRRLNFFNACYYSVQKVLSSRLLPKYLGRAHTPMPLGCVVCLTSLAIREVAEVGPAALDTVLSLRNGPVSAQRPLSFVVVTIALRVLSVFDLACSGLQYSYMHIVNSFRLNTGRRILLKPNGCLPFVNTIMNCRVSKKATILLTN